MRTVAANQQDLPQALPAFRQIARQWNGRFGICTARILPGEFYVTRNDEMITTVLGSCISASIRDPDTGVGGMNHFMLPRDTGTRHDQWGGVGCLGTRFGVAAMENLINEVLKQGSRKVKLFPQTGKVMVKRMESLQCQSILEQEKQYESTLGAKETPGEIDIF